MNFKLKLAIAAVFWISTLSGAFFYGYTQAVKSDIPENFDLTIEDEQTRSNSANEGPKNLSQAERDLLEKLNQAGGSDLISAFAYDEETLIREYLEILQNEGEASTLSSKEALSSLLQNISSGAPDKSALWRWVSALDTFDIPEALAALDQLAQTDSGYDAMVSRLIKTIAAEKPQQAIELANSIGALSDRNNAIAVAVSEWATHDPFAAFAWLGENPDVNRNVTSRAINSIFKTIANTNVDGAVKLLDEIGEQSVRNRAANGIMSSILESDTSGIQDVTDFLNSQHSNSMRGLLATALNSSKYRSFESGLELAEALSSTDSEATSAAYRRVVERNARDFPEQTASWAESVEDPKLQSTMLREVIEEWSRVDLASAGNWLSNAPSDPVYDDAFRHFANHTHRTDPSNAITWAEAISDDNKRDSTVSHIASQWAKRNVEAAIDYVKNTEAISPKVRESLIRKFNNQRNKR